MSSEAPTLLLHQEDPSPARRPGPPTATPGPASKETGTPLHPSQSLQGTVRAAGRGGALSCVPATRPTGPSGPLPPIPAPVSGGRGGGRRRRGRPRCVRGGGLGGDGERDRRRTLPGLGQGGAWTGRGPREQPGWRRHASPTWVAGGSPSPGAARAGPSEGSRERAHPLGTDGSESPDPDANVGLQSKHSAPFCVYLDPVLILDKVSTRYAKHFRSLHVSASIPSGVLGRTRRPTERNPRQKTGLRARTTESNSENITLPRRV